MGDVDLGARIRELRQRRGETLAGVASRVGIAKTTLHGYENNRREPDIETLRRLAKALETSSGYLLGETNDPSPLPGGDLDIIRSDFPIPPPGWEDLSEEEKEEVRQITRRFEETIIQDILEKQRKRGE